ncbi:MAG: TetR/AcrR family transcriptional regulator [Actinomycetota bacterium]|nr:TetR/AcrR family transcriptional regulator [Actinomycetota bacterium]
MTGPTSSTVALRPLRADAQRNRDKLIDVATNAFTEAGVDVPLEEIARRADVGIGTLYRNFPTREAVVLAVYRKQIDGLETAARTLPLTHPPAEALRLWMRGFVEYGAVKRGLVALLKSMMDTESSLFDDARATLLESAGMLMTAAVDAGVIRPGFAPADVIRALGGICMATDRPDAEASAISLVDLVFDGLRFGAVRAEPVV